MTLTPEMQAAVDAALAEALPAAVAAGVAAALPDAVAAEVKALKEKLDTAYAERDVANNKSKDVDGKIAELTRAHDLALLNARKETREAGNQQLTEVQKRLQDLEQHNAALSRDAALAEATSDFSFRSAAAATMARKMLSDQMVKNAEGVWVGKEGQTPKDLAKAVLGTEENAFMLKTPLSSGGGGGQGNQIPGEKSKALMDMSNEELFKKYRKNSQ